VKIVIFAGGTGSVALQQGLYRLLDENLDGVYTNIIVNAYDNGLSTGSVRRVMDGQILGPSDVRKNQTTRLQLTTPSSPWLRFLSERFTIRSSKAKDFCNFNVAQLMQALRVQSLRAECCSILFNAIEEYFKSVLATKIHYKEFSLANIIYAGIARINGNSLRAAAHVMADLMGIPDNILINDDRSLFLGAVTEKGQRVTDEGDIVSWGKPDPFIDIVFTDVDGNDARPTLCLEAWRAIVEADLIILSSGTQWSSLIPTYASDGFKPAINASQAAVLMVMNRTPDQDSPSQSASDIINILVPRYFDAGRLHVIADANGHPEMRRLNQAALSKVMTFVQADLSTSADPADKHDPDKLAITVGRVFFRDYLDGDFFLFDYDDTLVGRGNKYPRSSRFNVNGVSRLNCLTNVGICTGNTINAVSLSGEPAAINEMSEPIYKPLLVFADGGVNEYRYATDPLEKDNDTRTRLVKCTCPEALLPVMGPHSINGLMESLRKSGFSPSRIEIRGNVLVAIKPVDDGDRHAVMSLIQHIIHGSNLEIRAVGRTTIEICKPTLSKVYAIKRLCMGSAASSKITYVGDEFDAGNDNDIKLFATQEARMKCLHVGSPAKTAFFISTLMAYLDGNLRR